METNETLKKALVQEAEKEVLKLMEQLQNVSEGDLKELEQTVMTACFSIGRNWLEQAVNHQGQACLPARRQGECGHRQRLVGERPKQLLTLMGKVTMRRGYYQCIQLADEAQAASCSPVALPQDMLWGCQNQRSSPGVQKLVSYLGAKMTLEEAAEVFQASLPLGMSARQVLNLIRPVGEALIKHEDEQQAQVFHEAAQKHTSANCDERVAQEHISRMYIELDGVLARMRRGSVPLEEKEKKREGDVYREIKVGAVFAATQGPVRSTLAPRTFVDQAGPIRYVARRTTAEIFGNYLYALAQRCGIERAHQVVVLGDGAVWIWRLAAEHFPEAVQIVDLWHAREHVWKVAHAVFGQGHPQEAKWAAHACDLLTDGQIEELVAEIAVLPAVPAEPGTTRSVPEIEMDYFIGNAARMRYPAFRQQGMQIGSGVAEAACKTVVSTRAKRSGMRWTPYGLDAVLALRTAVLNGTYDDFWKGQPHLIA